MKTTLEIFIIPEPSFASPSTANTLPKLLKLKTDALALLLVTSNCLLTRSKPLRRPAVSALISTINWSTEVAISQEIAP